MIRRSSSRRVERFNTHRAVWQYLEWPPLVQAGTDATEQELDEMRRGPLQEQWVAIYG